MQMGEKHYVAGMRTPSGDISRHIKESRGLATRGGSHQYLVLNRPNWQSPEATAPLQRKFTITVHVKDQKYSILQLSTADFGLLNERGILSTSSQWYLHINNVFIIYCLLKVKEAKTSLKHKWSTTNVYPVVLPCQVTNSGLLCVPREFHEDLISLEWIFN